MPRGTCWKGYVQKGMKMKNGRSVPNCVPVQKAYLGKAVRQPTETDNEFKIRHEMHTPFMDIKKNKKKIVKANTGKSIKRAAEQLSNMSPGVGLDITDLAGLDRNKKESASIGAKLEFREDQVKPALNLSVKKDNIQGAISGTGKNDYGLGTRYLSDDKLTELGIDYSNTDRGKETKFTLKRSFNTGGLIKGKPKLALRGWK
jgi:hypothetical protein